MNPPRDLTEGIPAGSATEKPRPPRVLPWLVAFLGVKTLWNAANLIEWLLLSRFPVRLAGPGMLAFAAAGVLWNLVLLGVPVPALVRGKRWAWAAMQGTLVVQAGASLGSLVFSAVSFWRFYQRSFAGMGGARPPLFILVYPLAVSLFIAVCTGLLAVFLFRAREWFGVEPRRAWHTVYREGWWALAVTTLLVLGSVFQWVTGPGFRSG